LTATAVTSMGSLEAMVGEVLDLTPPLNVQPGTVLLTLRQGKPVGIVRSGRKLRRGRGLPMTMSPQGVVLSTETIPVTVKVEDIALQGAYPLSRVEAQLRLCIDERGDYAGLRSYVERKGLNFAALLDGEVANELDKTIRAGLHPKTAAELYDLGNITDLVALDAPLLDGLFRVESVVYATPTHHPEFLRAREAVARSSTDAAEKMLELHEQAPLDRQLSAVRDQQLLEEAARRGLSIVEHENPELVAQTRQGELEIKKALIEQLDALRRGGGSETIREVLGYLGSSGPAGTTPAAIPSAAGPGADIDGEAQTVEHRAVPSMPTLRTDPTLAHFWRAAGLPGEPMGISLDATTPDVTVLAICEDPLDALAAETVQRIFHERVGATTVIAIPGVHSLLDLVAGYLFARLPDLAAAQPTLDLHESGTNLLVRMSSEGHRMSRFLSQINDPEARMLEPLANVLPYDHLEVVGAEPPR
jgi:hypothetical protein